MLVVKHVTYLTLTRMRTNCGSGHLMGLSRQTPRRQTPPWGRHSPWADTPMGRHLPRQTPPGRRPPGQTLPRQTPRRQTPPGIHPLGRHPPSRQPQADTPKQTPLGRQPSWADTPPGQTSPSRHSSEQTPLDRHPMDRHPPCPVHAEIHPPAQCMLGYGKQASGTHPTGMHSCFPVHSCLSSAILNDMLF